MRSLFVSLPAVVLLAGCGPVDDCVPPPLTSPSIPAGLQGTTTAPFIVVQWDASATDLPDAYFEKATVDSTNVATGVTYASPRQLTIRLVPLAQLPINETVTVTIDLPDTKGFTQCRHPGEADSYAFHVELLFDGTHALTHADVTPAFRSASGAI